MSEIQFPEAFRFLFADKADDGGPVRYRAAHGGRGSAKSHSFASALILKAAQQPLRILCAREIQKSIKDSVKRLLDDKIASHGLSGYFESLETEIRGKNGSLIMFAGLRTNPDSIKSMEGLDIAAVFEASKVRQRSLDLLIPTVRKPGSELWFEWNPEHEDDPVDEMFRSPDGAPPGSIVRQVNYDQNPFFPDVLRRELEWDRERDPEKYQHVWLGGYTRNSEQRVFRNWRVEAFETPKEARFRFGADWGFSVDPTVLVRCYLDGRTLYVDRCVSQVGCEIDRTPALFDRIPECRKWPITADSSRPETVSYMRRHGFRIVPAVKGPGSLEDGVEFLKSFDIVVHPDCKPVIDELTLYSYKTDPVTLEILPVLEDKHNHTIDALRYALEGLRRMGPAPVVEKDPNPPDLWGRPRREADTWRTA